MRTLLSIHLWVRLILMPLAFMMTNTALAVSFIPMMSSSEVNGKMSKRSMNDSLVSSCVNNHCVYLPLVIEQVPEIWPDEILYPPRWPHGLVQSLDISYRWVDELTNPNHTWRYAFQYGIDDWNDVPSNTYFYFDNTSNNTIDMIYDSLKAAGYTDIWTAIVDWDYNNNLCACIWKSVLGYS